MNKLKNKKTAFSVNRGFTLMELLLAMAIIAILSGAILVSISSQRQKAYQSKMLAELSGVIQPMLMCRTDGNTVKTPVASGAICSDGVTSTDIAAYGSWPTLSPGYSYSSGGDFNGGTWYIVATNTTAGVKVCCNAISAKCHDQVLTNDCNSNQPAN